MKLQAYIKYHLLSVFLKLRMVVGSQAQDHHITLTGGGILCADIHTIHLVRTFASLSPSTYTYHCI
jgi:hypothetical protein